jgi:hypoxanthine phosphoribosyltransferase
MEAAHRILFNEQAIEQRVTGLAQDISRDYAGKDVVAVCVLKGALVFFTDLVRRITVPVTIDLIQASSYGSGTVSSRKLAISKDISIDIRNRHVLLIDTIIDTGKTMACLYKDFQNRARQTLLLWDCLTKGPGELSTCRSRTKDSKFRIYSWWDTGWIMERCTGTCPISP